MRRVPLGEVATIVSGATPKTGVAAYWGGDVWWATPADLSKLPGPYIDSTPRTVTASGLASCGATVLPVGSVLLSSRAPIGHVAINTVPMATNQGFKSLVPKSSQLDAKFLYHWLRSRTDYLQSLGNGVTFKEISKATVVRIEVPLPPLDEQRRIAAILDTADALRAKRRQILAHLDTLTQSIFLDMFGVDGDPRMAIGDFAQVATGSTPSRNDPENFGGTTPWVKTGEVQGIINSTSERVTEKGIRSARLKVFPVGSVIIAMYGQGKTRGQSAVLGVPATTNQACAVILPNEHFDSHFLQAQLAFEYERLRGDAEGGNQPNLSLGRVQRFTLLVPSIARQRAFAGRIGEVRAQTVGVEHAHAADNELFTSLQARAFSGHL